MFKNKKLFFISLIVCLIVFAIVFFSFMFGKNKSENGLGLLFVFASLIAFTMYTLMYISLNKNDIIRKIYKVIVGFCVFICLIGIMLFAFL